MIAKIGLLFTSDQARELFLHKNIRTSYLIHNFYADKYIRNYHPIIIPITAEVRRGSFIPHHSEVGYLIEVFTDINRDEIYGVFLLDYDFGVASYLPEISLSNNRITSIGLIKD